MATKKYKSFNEEVQAKQKAQEKKEALSPWNQKSSNSSSSTKKSTTVQEIDQKKFNQSSSGSSGSNKSGSSSSSSSKKSGSSGSSSSKKSGSSGSSSSKKSGSSSSSSSKKSGSSGSSSSKKSSSSNSKKSGSSETTGSFYEDYLKRKEEQENSHDLFGGLVKSPFKNTEKFTPYSERRESEKRFTPPSAEKKVSAFSGNGGKQKSAETKPSTVMTQKTADTTAGGFYRDFQKRQAEQSSIFSDPVTQAVKKATEAANKTGSGSLFSTTASGPAKKRFVPSTVAGRTKAKEMYPDTQLVNPNKVTSIEKPTKLQMYGNDFTAGLNNVWGGMLQTADDFRMNNPLYTLAQAAKSKAGGNKYLNAALDIVGNMTDPIAAAVDTLRGIYDRATAAGQARAQQYHYQTPGKLDDYIGMGVSATASAIPQAALAMATAGTSQAPQLANMSAGAVEQAITRLVNNPQFWLSFAQTAGPEYEKAKQGGANEITARASAFNTGIANALIEIGGGIETFQPTATGIARNIATSAFEEGREEVLQGAVSNLIAKGAYDPTRPFYSETNEDAVINPNRMAQEFMGGALAAGVMGGARTGLDMAYAPYANAVAAGERIRRNGDVENVYDEGLRQGTGTEAYRQARRFTPNTASDYRVGRQAELNARAMADEARMARLVNERTGYNVNYRDNMPNYAAGTNADGNIDINANKGQTVDTLYHETGHAAEVLATDEARAAADKTIEILKKPEYIDRFETRKNELKRAYDERGIGYTDEQIEDEIAVDMRRGGLLYRTSADYDRATRSDNYNRDRFVPNTIRRAASTVRSVFGGTVTNENAGITVSAKDANTIREAWERADNAAAGAYRNANPSSDLRRAEGSPPYENRGASGETEYSVETDADGNTYINIDKDILDGVPENEYRRTVRQFIKANFPSITINGEDIIVNADARGEFTNSKYSRMLERTDVDAYHDKLRMANNLDEILQNRENIRNSDPKHSRRDIIVGFEEGDINVKVGTNMYTAKVQIGIRSDGVKVLNDILDIKNTGVVPRVSSFKTNNSGRNQRPVSSDNSIANPDGNVKKDFSVDTNALESRLNGDELLNAYDTIEEIQRVGGTVDNQGYAYVYHNTSEENAEQIRTSGKMTAKEDGIFVSTKPDGYSRDYGKATVELKIPVERLVLDDIFDDEAHFRIPLENRNGTLDVSQYLVDGNNPDIWYSVDTSEQTRTDAFKQWFGDWENSPHTASKVVNADGTPKVVYHGTNAEFNTFSHDYIENTAYGKGFYFTDDENYASGYGDKSMAVYLDIKKPAQSNKKTFSRSDFRKLLTELSQMPNEEGSYYALSNYADVDSYGQKAAIDAAMAEYDYSDNDVDIIHSLYNALDGVSLEKYYATVKSVLGYDGIIENEGNTRNIYVVFNSNQVKSATDNIGTFDGNNSDIRYSVDTNAENETASSFGITNINDYIHVQRSVNNTLMQEGFFSDEGGRSRTVINADSGMVIEITPKGIKETFGEKNYYNLGRELKTAKLSTVRDLPSLIENGKLTADNESNKHNPNSVLKYAYIQAEAEIDGQPATINIDIRKSPQKNKFWVHSVDFVQNNSGVPSQTSSGMGSNDSATNNIPQNNGNVKYSIDTNVENEDKDVRAAANSVIRDYNVRYRVKADEVSDTFNRVLEGVNDMLFGEGDVNAKYESVADTARDAAKIIASKMYYSDGEEVTERYNALRREIKGTKINIDELAKSDIPDWDDFKKRHFGYFTIARDGIPLDSYYKQLAVQYPEYFDETKYITQGDQMHNIAETLDSMKPTETPLNEADYNEAVENITGDIMDRVIELAGKKWERSERERAARDKHRQEGIREPILKYTQAELDERLENQRKKFEDQQRRLEDSLAEVRKVELEYKKASEDRRKLLNVARRLNRMRTSPENLAKIPNILKELDTRSVKILEKGYTDKNGHEVMGRIDLQNLKTQYYKIAESDPNFIPDKNIESKIARLDKKQISEMDIGTVRDLTETLLKVEHEIRTHDKLINDEKRRTIAITAGKSVNEINRAKGTSLGAAANALNKYNSGQLSPERMFRRLGGYAKDGAFESLATALNDGQRKSMEFEMNATKKFDSLVRQKKEIKRFTGDNAEWIDISQYDKQGRKLYITPAMRASLAEHVKNYSNLRHIAYGGITIPNRALYERGRISDAYNRGEILKLTPEQVKEIVSGMTDYEKQFAETAHSFFNEDCTNAINETSLALEGYEKAGVKNYFPIVSNKDFTVGNFESLIRDGTIEGMGMLKERKTASNPIVLEDITQVITRQMKNVGKYYGLAIPVRNFNRVYNAVGSNFTYSTKQAIHQKWGTTATDYIENLLTDLQDGRRGKNNKLDSLRGNYAQATLAVNVGVTLKQAASYPTAAAELGYKPLIQAMGERVTKEDRAIIDKYTPLLWYRSKGYSTNELGDWANGAADDWTSKMPAVMGWIQAMDIATTTKLWKASEFYVRDNFKDLERGSDAYYKKTAEVYNRVIENTQPNYTTMQRPDILRSPNKLVNALTMFKTQVMQNYNILYDAYGEYRATNAAYKKGGDTEAKSALKTARGKLGLAISSQVVAAVVLNACDAIGRGIKGQLKRYYGDEDEDKITPESAVTSYLTSCANTIAGTALGGSEAAQLIEIILAKFGIGNADKWNDIEVSAINGVNEVVSDIQAMANTIAKNGASNPPAYMKAANSLAKDLGTMLGVPLKNIEDILSGMYNNVVNSLDDEGVIKPGVINRKRWDYYIKKYTGDPEVSNLSADTVEETERIKEALENGGFDKESGKTYVKYGDKTYELTQEQAKQYKREVNSITDEYMKSLLSGKNVEDVIDVEATLYAADMTDEQYSKAINKLQEAIDKAKKDTSKASAEAALQEFIDGKSKKKVSVTGKYSELPEKIKQTVINKVNSVAAGEAQTHMQGDIENSSKLVYTEPYHGRKPAYMNMFTSEKDNETGAIPTNPFASPTPEPTPEPTKEPKPEATPTPTQNPNAKRDNRVNSNIQTIADNLARAVPEKAKEYSADKLKINRIDSVPDSVEKEAVAAANEEYYSNLDKLMSGELNVEDVVGYTSKGKARTSEQADGTKIELTGKLYNDDGTPRFDEYVMGKILYKVKEAATDNAKAKYKDGGTGESTQVSSTGGLPFETSASAAELSDSEVGRSIVNTAEQYVGTPYVWGGESESGWDCSGYVINIFGKHGINIPERTTENQWASDTGVRITNQEDLQPGDCLYFADSSGDVHHVAIYMGDGMMVHAKGSKYGTVTESFADSDYYQSQFIGAKRYYSSGDSTVASGESSGGTRFRARSRSSGSSRSSRSSGSTRFRARESAASSDNTSFFGYGSYDDFLDSVENEYGIRPSGRTHKSSSSAVDSLSGVSGADTGSNGSFSNIGSGGVTGFLGSAALPSRMNGTQLRKTAAAKLLKNLMPWGDR